MEATLDSPEWKKLLAEKQHSPDMIKASAKTPADFSRLPGRLLQNIALVQALYTFGTGSSRSLRFVGASIRRKISELQAELQLRRLFARTKDYLYGGHEANDKTMISIRSEWTQLQSLVLEGRFSTKTQCKVIRLRAECVSTQLSAQASPPPHGLYEDLLDLVSVICTYPVTESLQRKVWGILLHELHKGSARHLVAAVDAESRDILLVLRHLAACKLAVWKSIPTQQALSSTGHARSTVRRQAFRSDTYDKQASITTGFYGFLLGLLDRFPTLVHTAFDHEHVHLLWLPKYMSETETFTGMIEMSYVLDDLSYWYHDFPKRLNAALSHEHNFFVHFLSTAEDDTLLKSAIEHLRTAVTSLSQADVKGYADAVDDVYVQHPGLRNPQLVHPALPFLLFAAHLLPHSLRASEFLLDGGLIEALRDLWVKDFPMTARYSTRWFKKDKSRAAMRLACVLALGSLASHSELRPRLAARIVTSDATASWFWDIAAYALYLQLGPTGTHWSACYSPISSLAFVVMGTMHKFPRDYDLQRRLEDPCSLVWIFQSSGNSIVDHELRTFSLDCLLRLAAQRTVEWKETLYILSGCNRDNMPVLEQTLRHALQHTPDSNCSLKSLQELIKSRKLPMTNPLDRFVMLMSNASRKNRFVSYAFANSGAGKLVDLLEEGQFDTYQIDESLASWRARTCRDVRQKLHDSIA